jgi:hypothetical protein
VPPAHIERLTRVRLRRQAVLTRPAPVKLSAVIDESTLQRRYGNDAVLREQLDHLVKMSQRPNVNIRILPRTQPAALNSCVIMKFPVRGELGPLHDDVVWIESHLGADIVTDEYAVHTYAKAAAHLAQAALGPEESREVIRRAAAQASR